MEECYQSNDVKPFRDDFCQSKIELIKRGMSHAKYPTIFYVFKAELTLAHGNAEVEKW